jgi:protein phosphatase
MSKLTYDVATALAQGRRDNQEDAVIADFPLDGDIGFAVLADGMGGHAAGDVASKIVVTEVFSELKLQSGEAGRFEANMPAILAQAASVANECVRLHAQHNPGSHGMGATLVAPVLLGDKMFWVSVGDSPLYLFRDGELMQLNEDHSLAGQIDLLVRKGLMDQQTAENHPDRHCLTSVLIGDEIARIDCPKKPLTLRPGDIVVVASDGLQFLENSEIEGLIQEKADDSSAEIGRSLISALEALDDPHQDNVSICVIKADTGQTQKAPVHITPGAEETISNLFLEEEAIAAEDEVAEEPQIAATASTRSGNKITLIARKTLGGLSMLYHFKRPSERSA